MKKHPTESPRRQPRDLPGHSTRRYGQLLLVALLLFPPPLWAATITVNAPGQPGPADDGLCSLQEAITAANDNQASGTQTGECAAGSLTERDEITLSPSLPSVTAFFDNNGTAGANALPVVTSDITVLGNGLTIYASGGTNQTRHFEVSSNGGDLTLESVTLTGGSTVSGGALLNDGGILTLVNTTVSGNAAGPRGGGIYQTGGTTSVEQGSVVSDNVAVNGGGLYVKAGTVTLDGAVVSINGATVAGGGLHIGAYGSATLTDTTVSGNIAEATGGGIHHQDYFGMCGSVTVTRSTISGNDADADGGGLYVSSACTADLTNSTISGNTATGRGGGVFAWIDSGLGLVNTTILGNSAVGVGDGDAIYIDRSDEIVGRGGSLNLSSFKRPDKGSLEKIAFNVPTLVNSLVGSETSDNCAFAAGASLDDLGGNLADDGTCNAIPATLIVGTDVSATLDVNDPDPGDGFIPTQTHALLCGSVAIDNAGACGLATDQRGALRDDGACDSGAYELQGTDAPGPLFPIALSKQTVDTVGLGVPTNIFNGEQPGNFGWLTWTGDPSVPALTASLELPDGNSDLYFNPDDPSDTVISVGDWVQGSPGVSNAKDIRNLLDALIDGNVRITVPIWIDVRDAGNNADYQVWGFAEVEIEEYSLPHDNMIVAIIHSLVAPGCS